MTISALPSAPLITDSPDVFDAKASAHVASLSQLVTELNAAISVVNMTKWISGTTYAIGDVTWSPADFQAYRRKTAGAGTTDPSADVTNWQRTEVSGTTLQQQTNTRFTAGGTADALTGTLSPAPASLVTGLRVSTTPVGANTVTAPNLNVNALGAKKVFKKDLSGAAVALVAGDYNASGPFDFEYNSALDTAAGGWILLSPLRTNPAAAPVVISGTVPVTASTTTDFSATFTVPSDGWVAVSATWNNNSMSAMGSVTQRIVINGTIVADNAAQATNAWASNGFVFVSKGTSVTATIRTIVGGTTLPATVLVNGLCTFVKIA